jgi:hypothetical protein
MVLMRAQNSAMLVLTLVSDRLLGAIPYCIENQEQRCCKRNRNKAASDSAAAAAPAVGLSPESRLLDVILANMLDTTILQKAPSRYCFASLNASPSRVRLATVLYPISIG